MSGRKTGEQFGCWRLEKFIDKGGNGEVWLASDTETGRKGAIKFLHVDYQKAENPRFKRFRDEIRTQASLADNPGVLPVLDSHLPDTPDTKGPAWLVTVQAEKLEDALGKHAQPVDVIEAVASFAETLAALHAKGISHRDIKPSNLFRVNGRWAVGDFGLVDYPNKEAITGPTEKLGPAHFIAPEMMFAGGRSDGIKADVYSLAKSLWALLAGLKFPPPGELRHDSPQLAVSAYVKHPKVGIIDRLIERATRHDPAARLTMAEFAAELRYWICPPEVRVSETKLDWTAAGERLKRERDRYEEECRARGRFEGENRQMHEGVCIRMERLMTEWSQKLTYCLNGGGLTVPPLAVPPESQSVANASVHMISPRTEHGRLTGWVGVQRQGTETLHIQAVVGIFKNDQSEILWSHHVTALAGSANYDHQVESTFAQLKEQFERHVPRYLNQL